MICPLTLELSGGEAVRLERDVRPQHAKTPLALATYVPRDPCEESIRTALQRMQPPQSIGRRYPRLNNVPLDVCSSRIYHAIELLQSYQLSRDIDQQ